MSDSDMEGCIVGFARLIAIGAALLLAALILPVVGVGVGVFLLIAWAAGGFAARSAGWAILAIAVMVGSVWWGVWFWPKAHDAYVHERDYSALPEILASDPGVAKADLVERGFRVDVVTPKHKAGAYCHVAKSVPAAGTEALNGALVTVVVACEK